MKNNNYSDDDDSTENLNIDDRYDVTGESEFSRENIVPFDQDEVLSERHYIFPAGIKGKEVSRQNFKNDRVTPEKRPKGEFGYRRSDEVLKEDVSEALYRNSEVDTTEIEVYVKAGNVTLKGHVKNEQEKEEATLTVSVLAGVEVVYNELLTHKDPMNKDPSIGLFNTF